MAFLASYPRALAPAWAETYFTYRGQAWACPWETARSACSSQAVFLVLTAVGVPR